MRGEALPAFSGYNSQYGRGVGNILAGVARRAVPYALPLLKKAGAKLLDFGLRKLGDTVSPKPRPPRRAIKRRTPARRPSVVRRSATRKRIKRPIKRTKRDILS